MAISVVAGQIIGAGYAGIQVGSVTATMPSSVTVGNSVIIGMNIWLSGSAYTWSVNDISQSAGTSTIGPVVMDGATNSTTTTVGVAIYRVPITGPGTLSLKFTANTGTWFTGMGCAEFKGMSATPLDVSGSNSGTGTSHTTNLQTAKSGMIFYTASEESTTNFSRTFTDQLITKADTGTTTYTGMSQYRITGPGTFTITDGTGADSSAWQVRYAQYLESPSPYVFHDATGACGL